MQNWNQWQLPAAPTVSAPMPQPPIGYATPGADPMAVMQSYMQYFNQPAPSGYTAEQWAAAQQQNWAQWQNWQQQYQQWQAQYGEKYQETMKQMSTQGLTNITQITPSSIVQPPPLPKEDTTKKPPLPPECSTFGFPVIPPHQNNLPLFPSNKSANPPLPPGQPPPPSDNSRNLSVENIPSAKRVANSGLESVSAKKSKVDDEDLTEAEKTFDARFKKWEEQFNKWKLQNANHPDKTQYKQYESEWTSWREKLIERREQMRRKREQQKQAAIKAETEKEKKSLVEDNKILNILSSTENQGLINNLLGIGKTLGLTGKNDVSHGQPQAPMVQPPSAIAAVPSTVAPIVPATAMGAPSMTPNMNQAAWAAQQWAAQYNAGMNMTNYAAGYQQPTAVPQLPANALPTTMPMTNFSQPPTNFNQPPTTFNQPPTTFTQPPTTFNQTPTNFNQQPGSFNFSSGSFNPSIGNLTQPAANFNQPPPGVLGSTQNFPSAAPNLSTSGPNFSQPPPGFGAPSLRQQTENAAGQQTGHGNPQDQNARQFRPDGDQRQSSLTEPRRDSMGLSSDRCGFDGNRFSGPPPNNLSSMNRGGQFGANEPYGRDESSKNITSGNQSGSGNDNSRRDDFGFNTSGHVGNDFRPNDQFGSGFDRGQGGSRSSRDGDSQESRGNNRIGSERDNFNSDRFGSNNDRFGLSNEPSALFNDRSNTSNERFGPSSDRLGSNNDRFASNNDRFSSNNDRFGSNNDRFGSNNDRFGSDNDRLGFTNDRSGSNNDRFGSGNDRSKPDSDRFGSSNDRFCSQNDQFGSSGDRSGSSVDRPSMASLNQSNDNFRRPPPDRMDLRDVNRDSSSSNFRNFGKSNQFNPPMDMPPELQKLMAKRKAAMDVFKPSNFGSFLDSSKSSSTSTSLSESFRKITGDSPFLSRSSIDFNKKDTNFGPNNPMLGSPGPGGPGIFDSPRDLRPNSGTNFQFRQAGDIKTQEGGGDFSSRGVDFPPRGNEFRPRELGGIGQRGNEFNSRDSRDFGALGNIGSRGNEFNARAPRDFGSRDSLDVVPRANEFNARDAKDFGLRGNVFDSQESNGGASDFGKLGDVRQRRNDECDRRNDNVFEDPTRDEEKNQQTRSFESSDKQATTSENSEMPLTHPPIQEGLPMNLLEEPEDNGRAEKSSEEAKAGDDVVAENVPPLQAPPWMESEFADDDIIEVPVNKSNEEANTAPTNAVKDDTKPSSNLDSSETGVQESEDRPTDFGKKSDDLPFMGENDPKPEDLNMEPPPELPNLGAIMTDSVSPFASKDSTGPFDRPPGNLDQHMNLRSPFDSSRMQTKPDSMSFGAKNSDDSRLPPSGTRHMSDQPLEHSRSVPRALGSADGLQLGPRGPSLDSFKSGGSTTGEHGARGPADLGPRGPEEFAPSGPSGFGPRGPGDFGSRGPGDFGPQSSGNLGPRGLGDFGPRGPSDFGPRGPENFGPQGPANFGPGGPGSFSPCGPFPSHPRGPGDFGSRGPLDFGQRGPSGFGPGGPSNYGPRGSSDFGPRGPFNSGPCGSLNLGPRGPSDLASRGLSDFESRGPSDFGPRSANDRSLGPRDTSQCGPFGPRGPLDRPFAAGSLKDQPFAEKLPFGSNTFGPGGNTDKPGTGIPSLMSFKLDRPPIACTDNAPAQKSDTDGKRWNDLPPAFRRDDQGSRSIGGSEPREDRNALDQGPRPGPNTTRGQGGPDWREPFSRNKFGDSDQRSGSLGSNDASGIRPGNQMLMDQDRPLLRPKDRDKDMAPFVPDTRIEGNDGNMKSRGPIAGPGFDAVSVGTKDNNRSAGSIFSTRPSGDRAGIDGPRDFCVEKQFNYNHGGSIPEKITKEHAPANVIDYAHAPRVIVHDYVTPAQSFDYGHGNLKPIVPEHEIYSKRDFRNWVETEQNLREYTDRMMVYESDMRALKRRFGQRQVDVPPRYRERDIIQDDRRSFDRDRDRRFPPNRSDRSRKDRDTSDQRERDRRRDSRERGRSERDRQWERTSNKQREDRSQHRRSKSKDRIRERPEKIRKETNRDNKKDDERSKGNVADSESSAKKPDEPTSPDNSKQESNDGEPEVPPQTTEVAKNVEAPKPMEPPATMELPKTPNFTMVHDLLSQPGRQNRPPKIVVILRGPPGSGKSFIAKLIKDKEVEQGGSAPRILSLDDYFLTEKEIESVDNNGKKIVTKEMVYEYEEAMEPSYVASLAKAFKKNITDGFFNFIILDSINEKISDYEEMWSFAKTKGFRVYVCEMEMDVQICLKRNIHNRTEDEINRIVDYFEPTPGYHQKLDVTSMLQEEAIEEVHMEDTQDAQEEPASANDDSQDSQEEPSASAGVSKWERMEAEDKLDRLDGLAKRKHEGKPQTMEDFLQVPDYYNMEDTSGKRRVRWADLEERKEQEKMRAVGFVVGQTNWDRMMDPTKGGSALTQTKYI